MLNAKIQLEPFYLISGTVTRILIMPPFLLIVRHVQLVILLT